MGEYNDGSTTPESSSTREKIFSRLGQLKSERASWWSMWQDITNYIMPDNGRYFRQDRNKGWKRTTSIYDNTPTRSLRTLGAGMMSGGTSPARPWFRCGTGNQDLDSYQPVKLWLDHVTKTMLAIFQKSNTYRTLHGMYEEQGGFGTAVSVLLPDFKNVIHHYPVTTGEYCLAQDYQGRVCTMYREFEKTVGELVKEFGIDNCSNTVQSMFKNGQLDQWIPVLHAIEPRADRDPSKSDNKNMPWGSWYYEIGGDKDKCLRESGFKRFPVLAPRWSVRGGNIYGTSPGMEVLGDVKQLQLEQKRKAQVIDYQTNPPLQVPVGMKNREIDTLPGGVTYIDGSTQKIESTFNVGLDLQHLLMDIQDVRERIRGGFYADLFLMLANSTNPQMTATEVAERHEEKMLMLGPVIERQHNELLEPLIDITFDHMIEAGLVPPPPPELLGMDLSVEFISVLAQAQRAIGTNGVDRFVMNLGTVAQMKADVLDNFNSDEWANRYSDMLSVDPNMIVASKDVAVIRQARAKAQAAQAQAAAMQQNSQTVKNLATSPAGAGGSVLDGLTGYT